MDILDSVNIIVNRLLESIELEQRQGVALAQARETELKVGVMCWNNIVCKLVSQRKEPRKQHLSYIFLNVFKVFFLEVVKAKVDYTIPVEST